MRIFSFPVLVSLIAFLTAFGGDSKQETRIPVRFSHPTIVRYDHDGFVVRGKEVFIYGGSFHYFRCDPAEWRDRLEKMKAAGFNTVETYVPWNWTERQEGRPDFTALDKFLTECQETGLYVIIRPGPYICAEWDVGGFPEWLAGTGKGVGFRTDSPADIRWSKYWYDEVLPVIRRHLITNGGSIIMMQIENEYDYDDLPDSAKRSYLKSLYHDAMSEGINVPIITCWTRQVRDNSDPVFSQIMDACNFYPGWNIESTRHAIEQEKEQEPESPPMITELQGGWFSSVGDDSMRLPGRYGPQQINALTKYVIAHGIKALNYYMLYGGTNFGYWGSKGRTTSYDYTAPISEPGGLWGKYRAVKLIGDFIKMAGPYLVHSHELKGGAVSETRGVQTLLRTDRGVGLLYVWNTNDAPVKAEVTVNLPGRTPTNLSIPMQPKDAYFLPVNFPLPDGKVLFYSNVQVSSISRFSGKPLIVAYGHPGDDASLYAGQSLCTETIKNEDRLYSWDGIYVLLTTDERAARSVSIDVPSGPATLVSDSYLAIARRSSGKVLDVSLQTRPGRNSFSLLAPVQVASVSLDGKAVKTVSAPGTGMITFSMTTPQAKLPRVGIAGVRTRPDDEAPDPEESHEMKMAADSFATLGSQGDYEDGYTVYNGKLTMPAKGKLICDYYDDDWHAVLVDGRPVQGLTGSNRESYSNADISEGTHKLTVIYENEGRPNIGFMDQEKGLKSITMISSGGITTHDNWKRAPEASAYPGENPEQASATFDDSGWREVTVGKSTQDFIHPNEGWWFRTRINLSPEAVRHSPALTFKGIDDNALVYVNGKLAVKHRGWNTPFTVAFGTSAKAGSNIVAVYVQNNQGVGGIYRPVILKWGTPVAVEVQLRFHHSLRGRLAGWQSETYDDAGWKALKAWASVPPARGITWYRGTFTLPSRKGWVTPWRLHVEATGNAQIWINGRLLGRYFAEGPQTDFYLPGGWLNPNGRNSVAFVLRPTGTGAKATVIKSAYVDPYPEYVVQKHTLEIKLK